MTGTWCVSFRQLAWCAYSYCYSYGTLVASYWLHHLPALAVDVGAVPAREARRASNLAGSLLRSKHIMIKTILVLAS